MQVWVHRFLAYLFIGAVRLQYIVSLPGVNVGCMV